MIDIDNVHLRREGDGLCRGSRRARPPIERSLSAAFGETPASAIALLRQSGSSIGKAACLPRWSSCARRSKSTPTTAMRSTSSASSIAASALRRARWRHTGGRSSCGPIIRRLRASSPWCWTSSSPWKSRPPRIGARSSRSPETPSTCMRSLPCAGTWERSGRPWRRSGRRSRSGPRPTPSAVSARRCARSAGATKRRRRTKRGCVPSRPVRSPGTCWPHARGRTCRSAPRTLSWPRSSTASPIRLTRSWSSSNTAPRRWWQRRCSASPASRAASSTSSMPVAARDSSRSTCVLTRAVLSQSICRRRCWKRRPAAHSMTRRASPSSRLSCAPRRKRSTSSPRRTR